jgi:ribokinase
MKILNFGSLNIDHVYAVDHIVRPGETLNSNQYRVFMGGKGSNQSLALAYAGARVFHAGKLGKDGLWLRERLQKSGVDTGLVEITEGPSGHAIIQVNKEGENAIVLFGGANRTIAKADAARVLSRFGKGDYLLLQNEISAIPDIMREASRIGLAIVLNPAPMHRDVLAYPLDLVACFIVNEIEGAELTGAKAPDKILAAMQRRFPSAMTVLTLGADGAVCTHGGATVRVPAVRVKAVDTTAAGDTFIGYFLAGLMSGAETKAALEIACQAAAICVTRPGAADSIPKRKEVTG